MLSLVTSSYSDLVKPENLLDKVKIDEEEMYFEYQDLKDIRQDVAAFTRAL